MTQLVLASSSPFRRELLDRLQLPYVIHSPDIDETPLADESPEQLVVRLAQEKARAVAQHYPEALIIGSDQVADHGGVIIGKPKDHADAVHQLQTASGNTVYLHCGLALYNSAADRMQSAVVPYQITFKTLDLPTIEKYLELEQPMQCCGSLKSEGIGISMLSAMRGDDPTAIIGLPLIRLVEFLQQEGVGIL